MSNDFVSWDTDCLALECDPCDEYLCEIRFVMYRTGATILPDIPAQQPAEEQLNSGVLNTERGRRVG